MKPTLNMDEKSANIAVVMQPAHNESEPSKRNNKRLVIGIVSGITLLLIVVAAILMAVFLGAKVGRDSQKEAWLNYQDKNGEKKSEHVVATDKEEDMTVPNEMRVIYDFEKGFAIYKMEKAGNDEGETDYNVCYVTHLNKTNLATPKEVKDSMTESEVDVNSDSEAEIVEYESSTQELPRDLLSPRAQEMCKDSKIIWMTKRNGETREKRAKICYNYICYYYYLRVGSTLYLRRRCIYYNFHYC